MSQVEDVSVWILDTLSNGNMENSMKVCTILWGIWMWRNKKVWEGKSVSAAIAMDNSFNHVSEWRLARTKFKDISNIHPQHPLKYPSNGNLLILVC